ncbi:HAD family hydrolase [Granulicella tundricola]|uniref:HAD-superfamily hydrolase, subfamily IA, variant 3 n=1 Tax=Granulicella tundricola (strain ATCC BAA-1859 / DSM 23138 / MP5ACTX9) TaxID=1198114 RepID=E8X4F8_GRATM|nr:HAD family phosphatase [Granulicella tundricola]ADW68285.1 HAD-superfamily hydrolase, subfamily IA, variant 3 [Granulicella tundricola MP5ACTX9]
MSETALVLPEGEFKAFLFDMDGTVADSMPIHYLAWVKAVTEQGGTFPEDVFYAWGGIPPARVAAMLNEKYGYSLDATEVTRRKEELYFESLPTIKPIASVVAHIEASRGKIRFAIVSGSPRESIEKTLTFLGLLDSFEVLVGAEDYAKGKPDAEPFLRAAELLGIAPKDCLVFEDADAGIASAEAAGMSWVRVPGPVLA